MTVYTNADQFILELEREASDLGAPQTRRLQKLLTFEFVKRVSDRTPVDTGRARAGWIVSVGQPSDDENNGSALRSEKESKESAAARLQMQNENLAETRVDSLPLYSVVYISNNVNYIKYLEEGTAKRKPEAMMASAFADIQAIANQRIGGAP